MSGFKDKFTLTGKTVVITGGAGILGKRFCHGLAEMGAQLAIVDVNRDALNSLCDELQSKYGTRAMGYVCNIAREDEVKNSVAEIVKDFSQIDVLHNNAAAKTANLDDFFAPFEEFSLDVWREIMAVNIDGMFLMAKYVGRHMIEKQIKGSIIQTASIYGVVAPDQRIYEGSKYLNRQINTPAVYSASKAAVVGLTQYLSTYWGAKGIRVNTITPGGVESGQNDEFKNRYANRVPLGRMAQADEMVNALIFLASDASSYVTGQNMIVDGGLTAW